jgi:signal transduction histidine kinase
VFDAFFTTRIAAPGLSGDNEHVKGTGLGLWIVSQIVSNVGGEISVIDPEPGFATTFEILIPKEKDNG